MKNTICCITALYHQKIEKIQLWLLRKILKSEIHSEDIVKAYGGCDLLLQDLCESNYENEIIDFVLQSEAYHEIIY